MTATKLRMAMQRLHWSQKILAEELDCSERLIRMWANADAVVPAEVGEWLEALVLAHATHKAPTTFRRRRGPPPGWQRQAQES